MRVRHTVFCSMPCVSWPAGETCFKLDLRHGKSRPAATACQVLIRGP